MKIIKVLENEQDQVLEDPRLIPIDDDPYIVIEGGTVGISNEKNYPYIFYEHDVRRYIYSLSRLGPIDDIIGPPETSTIYTPPPIVPIGNDLRVLRYRFYDLTTKETTYGDEFQIDFPKEMDVDHHVRVRAEGGRYIAGLNLEITNTSEWSTFTYRSGNIHSMAAINMWDTLPDTVIRGLTSTFRIYSEYASYISGVHIKIKHLNGIIINGIRDNIPLGTDISYTVLNRIGRGTIDYVLVGDGGYETKTYTLEPYIIDNIPPSVDGFTHTLPLRVAQEEVVNLDWSSGDIDGSDGLYLVVTNVINGYASTYLPVMSGQPLSIIVNKSTGDRLIVTMRLFDGYSYSEEMNHTSLIEYEPPIVSGVRATVNGVLAEKLIFEPGETYPFILRGLYDPNNRPFTIHLMGPNNISFDRETTIQHVEFNVTIGLRTNRADFAHFTILCDNGQSESGIAIGMPMEEPEGTLVLTTHGNFVKPSGITTIIVRGSGSTTENTILTGGVAHEFVGTDLYDKLFVDLDPGPLTIIATPAVGTVLSFMW